jgi:Ca-activated chloride channel family protein
MKPRSFVPGVVCLTIFAVIVLAHEGPATKPSSDSPATRPAQLKIDLDSATPIDFARDTKDLEAREFHTKDHRAGWLVKIPGGRPIATPAYADGLLFVGGGYGSHEFYAFDADTGKKVWQINTADDGPTAAVVEDGCCAFNTESCTIIVVDAKTGKLLWQEWLGDPLMSQPAISHGRLYIAYPGGQPRGNLQQVQAQGKPAPAIQNVGPATGHGHRLLCADLKTGKHLWEQDITADVLSAPVIDNDQVFLTCFDGTSFAIKCDGGSIVWKKQNAGTSAPLIASNQVLLMERQQVGDAPREGVQRLDLKEGKPQEKDLLAAGKADYLKAGKEGSVALAAPQQAALDSSVGFAGGAPSSSGLNAAKSNVNVGTVAGGWAYQGSRAAFARGQILNSQANRFNCIRAADGMVAWQAEAVGNGITDEAQLFSPPALGGDKLYTCSARGHLIALDQKTGKIVFLYSTGIPIAFQPALARGNLYAGTADGALICLKTNDPTADGWTSWGGNAQHNKND